MTGLDQILREIEADQFPFSAALEDIHLNIEARLTELIGEPGRKLHTARSRNDQVATDFRLWVRAAILRTDDLLRDLQAALLARAEEHSGSVMPGFTHLQAAQPVTLGHHLLAYVEMLGRDRGRFADAGPGSTNARSARPRSPARASRSTATMTAAELGFARPCANSIDAVADRDFALEFLAAAAISAVHLSRLAEELVLWSTPQFAFVRMAEEFSSGSSIMPQKRNPDAAELVRAKTGRVIGSLNALLIVLKGLPLAYAKDLQEDKEPVFDAADSLALCLAAMAAMIARHDDRHWAARGRGRDRSSRPRPTLRTGWCGRRACRSAPPTGSRPRWCAGPRRWASSSRTSVCAELQAIEPRITAEALETSLASSARSRPGPASAAPHRSGSGKRSRPRGIVFCELARTSF